MTITTPGRMCDVDGTIAEVVERLTATVDADRIVLFGSRARGDARPDSDLDVLVVVPNGTDQTEAEVQMGVTLMGLPLLPDLFVTTPEIIRRRARARTSVLRTALQEGTVLYERDPPSPVLTHAIAECMTRRPPMSGNDPAQVELALNWWRTATGDLQRARLLLAQVPVDTEGACYNAQQSAEKALKAAFELDGFRPPRTHLLQDLQKALTTLPHRWPQHASYHDLTWLSKWSEDARYPNAGPFPTDADAARAVPLAEAIYEGMAAALLRRGLDVHTEPDSPSVTADEESGYDL